MNVSFIDSDAYTCINNASFINNDALSPVVTINKDKCRPGKKMFFNLCISVVLIWYFVNILIKFNFINVLI